MPALALRDSLHKLSVGWGRGLFGVCAFFGTQGVSHLALALSSEWCAGADRNQYPGPFGGWRNNEMLFVAICSLLPLLIAMDLASTSSMCDILMDELNDAGMRHGFENDPKIDWVVRMLSRLNSGQGLVSDSTTSCSQLHGTVYTVMCPSRVCCTAT